MLVTFLRVALVAISLALDVFAVSVGVGIRGVDTAAKVRIGASFAAAEVAMNCIGASLGALLGRAIGDVAAYFGFAALIGVGIYMIVESLREGAEEFDLSRGFGLLIASLSISLDSLGIGFSIVYIGVPVYVTLAAVAVASVLSTTLGLTFGARFGTALGERAELIAGVVLLLTGLAFAVMKVAHAG
jgi:putative Mn2+ efflux pump MntP